MNAYLISGVISLPFAASAFLSAPLSGISFDGRSSLLRSDADLDEVESKLLDRLPEGEVHRMSRDVIVFGDDPTGVIQRMPSVSEGPVLDFSMLTKPAVDSKPVVFFHPGLKKRYSSMLGWIDALSAFGYDIRTVGKHEEFRRVLADLAPDIVCFSAYERHVRNLAQAYQELAEIRPGAVTMLGGYAALPSAANFFDVVVPGEGDFILPLLLRFLQSGIAEGAIDTDMRSRDGEIPPHLTPEQALSIRNMSARRFVHPIVGDSWAEMAVNVGSHLYIRGSDDNGGIRIKYEGPRDAWPIPINSVELKTLWRLPPPSSAFQRNAFIYAQRGCHYNPDKRCWICSITSPAGRRLDVPDVIDALVEMRDRGVVIAVFGDDYFLSNKKWVADFLDGVEREKLGEDMVILMATRADDWTEPTVRRMLDLGLHIDVGLETFSPVRAERLGKVRPGRGEAYVRKGIELLTFAAEYARDNGRYVGDLVRAYIIMAGVGDSLDDILDDVRSQLRFFKGLRERGMRGPWLSANVSQRVHARSRLFEERGDLELAGKTRFAEVGEYLDVGAATSVDMGDFVGDFHPFHLDQSGEAVGMLQPRSFKGDKFVDRLIELVNEHIYGGRDPDIAPKPDAEALHGAVLLSLRDMEGELAEHYGSKERAEEVVGEFSDLYGAAYAKG